MKTVRVCVDVRSKPRSNNIVGAAVMPITPRGHVSVDVRDSADFILEVFIPKSSRKESFCNFLESVIIVVGLKMEKRRKMWKKHT